MPSVAKPSFGAYFLVFVLGAALLGSVGGCAYNMKAIDVAQVQSNVVKGKTTQLDIEKLYGNPYEKGITRDGTSYYYYLSANLFTGSSQDFTFYFDKEGRVASYATEYPGGNPLLQK